MSEIDTLRSRWDSGDVSCEVLITFLFEYLASESTLERAREVEDHLARCPSCAAYLATYRATIELARASAGSGELDPADLPRHLVEAILAARQAPI